MKSMTFAVVGILLLTIVACSPKEADIAIRCKERADSTNIVDCTVTCPDGANLDAYDLPAQRTCEGSDAASCFRTTARMGDCPDAGAVLAYAVDGSPSFGSTITCTKLHWYK
jgi:hypothetical protein